MKKTFILLITLLFLTSCTQDTPQPISTETPLPTETSKSINFNETFVNMYCYDALENDDVYCGYLKGDNNIDNYDISWLRKKTMLDGSETYYEDLNMEAVINDDNVLFPVNRKFCETMKTESVEMYAGLWCQCYELNDEAFYIDINDAFNGFNEDTQLRFSTGHNYTDTLSGISFGDTKIYELLQSGEKFKPYPSAYMYFPASVLYNKDSTAIEDAIEKYHLVADLYAEDGTPYYLLIKYAETETGYFVTITVDDFEALDLPTEITDYTHVVAHGYILK